MTNLLSDAAAAMRLAEPVAVLRALSGVLAERFGTVQADLLLIDYQQAVLCPLVDRPGVAPLAVDRTLAGRAFASQLTQVDATRDSTTAHLPVTVRGDRIGVLSITLPAETAEPLAELESLADLLAHLLVAANVATDAYAIAARTRPLTLAAEMQWQLLPGRSHRGARFAVAGHLEPAYSIGGDSFDWSTGPEQLAMAVTDATGRGVSAAMLGALAITALRNARRSGADLAAQASLADQALYSYYGGEQFVSAILLSLELGTGRVQVVDAGSPQVLRVRAGEVEHVTLDAQLPLGMFEDTRYVAQEIELAAGDRLVIVSDGVIDALAQDQVAFGNIGLPQTLRSTANLPAPEVVRAVTRRLLAHRGEEDLHDDAVVVVLDWTGP